MKRYRVSATRLITRVYEVEAMSQSDALVAIGQRGDALLVETQESSRTMFEFEERRDA